MEATEMDVEGPEPTPKRYALRNSIQTNFGDDYVFQIVAKNDWTSMAVSLSTKVVKLYSPFTGHYFGECKGHSSTINQIAFSGPTAEHVLHSCSSDGTIRAWDTRSCQQVSCVSAGPSQEIFCISFGGSDNNFLAAGSKSQIFFWDWRTRMQIACLEESHTDDVTQVHFVPYNQNKLVSTSVDGLMCLFDVSGSINDDDHLESVINVGTSIGKVDYFIDCHHSGEDQLWAIGGTGAGTLGYFPVNCNEKGAIGHPEAVLHGGHTGIVRSLLPMTGLQGGRGIFGWTGGEDGRLCCWSSDESSSDVNRSWISTELVVKSPKDRRKSRHHPY